MQYNILEISVKNHQIPDIFTIFLTILISLDISRFVATVNHNEAIKQHLFLI